MSAIVSGGTLTKRRLTVLQLIAEGLSNAEIAETMTITEETVKTHVRWLLAWFGVRSRAHAVAEGFRMGVIS